MGRGAQTRVNEQALAGRRRGGFKHDLFDDIQLDEPEDPGYIGSDSHRRRLGEYARARTGRQEVRVTFIDKCLACGHDYRDCHPDGRACSKCSCPKYISGGTSFTDMAGNIAVKADQPPRGPVEDREIVINGALRHEVCHELYTNPDAFREMIKELERMSGAKKEVSASQIKTLWNILEDGMIEERERQSMPGSFRYIAARNKVWPKVPADGEYEEVEHENAVQCPNDYVPTDIHGNALPTFIDESGNKMVKIEAGTKLGVWGPCPVSLEQQAQSALLAASLPQYEPGELHPIVQSALAECEPHIAAAVGGNTSDCICRAYAVQGILRKHGLLREDLSDEERDDLEQLYTEMGVEGPSAPQPDDDAGPQQGQQMQPMNGVPQQGSSGMSQQMQQAMGQGTPSRQDDESAQQAEVGGRDEEGSDEEEDSQGEGPAGEDKELGDDEKEDEANANTGEQGYEEDGDSHGSGGAANTGQDDSSESAESASSGEEDDAGGEGAESGGGEEDDTDIEGAESGDKEGDRSNSQGFEKHQGADGDGLNGYDPNAPIPQSLIDNAQRKGRGDVGEDELDQMRKDAKRNLESDHAEQTEKDQRRIRKNQIDGSQYRFKDRSTVVSQSQLTAGAAGREPDDDGSLHSMGKQLGMRIKRIKSETRAPQRRRMTGRLDSRAYARGMAGDPKVYERKGFKLDLDLEIDVSIDRSLSIDEKMTAHQYQMAKMMAIAGKDVKVPMAIYGWQGGMGARRCEHYAFKERHSHDMRGLAAIFQVKGLGTPTAEGVKFSRRRLANSSAAKKVMVVVTDGAANDIGLTREQVDTANSEGIEVVGMAFGCDARQMDEQFGAGRWTDIDDFLEAPKIVGKLIERVAQSQARRR